jgi:hypothetical protein
MRKSKWTEIYMDVADGKLFAYIRFVPDIVCFDETKFSHGIPLGNIRFDTEEEAIALADEYDLFFDVVEQSIIEGLMEIQ